ncbi:MAG TPA: TIGR03621 family F420-dependent LLM class oxidoreductase [Acidimicrobiales bacterium]|nr:TIGR03621 family F420-dependent LLM class oxidoreductase [Acidimicrobiales bacterium]
MLTFGVSALSAPDGEAWRADARRFAAAGFDTLWVPDHVGLFDPFPAITAAAAAAPALTVGTYVLNVELWNPLLLARVVATTHLVTDGRLVVGLGAGHAADEFAQAGLRYPSAGERVGRLEATVPALRRLLAGETVDDERLGLAQAATGLAPVDTPLLVGGNGDRVLDLAGREADIVGLVGVTSGTGRTHTNLSHWGWEGLADRLGRARRAAEAAGRSVAVDVLVQRARVTDDPAAALADFVDAGLRADMFDSPFLLVGDEDEVVARLERLHGEHGVAGVTVFAHDAEALAPVIARLRA